MSKEARVKCLDLRVPVWQGIVKGKLVTIYDLLAYEESKRLYPDDSNTDKLQVPEENKLPKFKKKKSQARYNWITKLDQPLGGKVS